MFISTELTALIIARKILAVVCYGIAAWKIYKHYYGDRDENAPDSFEPNDQETYYDIDTSKHYTLSGADCTMMDWRGVVVDHLITFDEFTEKWCKYYLGSCHHFTKDGFLFDEGGSMGLDNSPVGFKYKEDCIRYRKWLKDYSNDARHNFSKRRSLNVFSFIRNISNMAAEAEVKRTANQEIINIIDNFYRPCMYISGHGLDLGFSGFEFGNYNARAALCNQLNTYLQYDEINNILKCAMEVDQEILSRLRSDREFNDGMDLIYAKYQFKPFTKELAAAIVADANKFLEDARKRGCLNDLGTYGTKVVHRFNTKKET